jgi:Skp family chaperone for outer membrane proteins
MKVHHRLVAGAALGAIALTAANPAAAKPRKHATAHKRAVDPRDAEIKALEAKVDALTQRLDAQEAAQQSTAQQAQTAQAAATAAQSQASAALTQSQAAQTQVASVQKAVPPLEKAIKTGWFANTSISGKAFFNVSDIHQTSTDLAGVKTDNAQNGTQTELKRFYVGVDHKFNDVFSANITTDFRYNANGTSKDVLVYVKKAYVQAKLAPELWVRVGAADLPWVPFDEGIYGYRFVENTLIDRTKFGTSSDWGVHVGGTFGNNLVSYQVSAINGAGYKTLSRSSDTLDLEGRISVNPIKSITLAVGGYTGKLGKSAANLAATATPHHADRFDALAAYTDKRIRAGVEYFWAKNWNNITTVANDKSNGWSAFGSFAFTPQILAFGRYDRVKPSSELNPALKDRYFNVGLDYKPLPPLDLALVYKRDRANNGFLSTSNGTIGGLDRGTYNEIGLFGQVAF